MKQGRPHVDPGGILDTKNSKHSDRTGETYTANAHSAPTKANTNKCTAQAAGNKGVMAIDHHLFGPPVQHARDSLHITHHPTANEEDQHDTDTLKRASHTNNGLTDSSDMEREASWVEVSEGKHTQRGAHCTQLVNAHAKIRISTKASSGPHMAAEAQRILCGATRYLSQRRTSPTCPSVTSTPHLRRKALRHHQHTTSSSNDGSSMTLSTPCAIIPSL